ncbi:hypothetical protein [Clostridium sp. Marseille-P299]|uniref:hypothetical protein n=1 Tax=Clostridium sp. Marseille-P299 TaxID=1805477 RepID=UPI00082F6684|nr:hypothetical protein [Clostridium sp. Marseille-P299]
MSIELKPGTVSQVVKGTTLFAQNGTIDNICMILKGRVMARSKGVFTVLTPGCFIGINDIYLGRYLNDYIAVDDLAIYTFAVEGLENEGAKILDKILEVNKDYGGLIVYSLCNYLKNIIEVKLSLSSLTMSLYTFIKSHYKNYIEIGKGAGVITNTMPQVEELYLYESEYSVDNKKLQYYLESSKIPVDIQKSYFSYTNYMVSSHIEEISTLIAEATNECMELAEYIEDAVYVLMNDGEQSLFKNEAILAMKLNKAGNRNEFLMEEIDKTVDQINKVDKIFTEKVGRSLQIDREKMEQLYYALISGENEVLIHNKQNKLVDSSDYLKELEGSLQKILRYSTLEQEEMLAFTNNIEYFINASDRLSIDDTMRLVKREISKTFYELYENIFLLSYGKTSIPKAVELFLNYGYIDERLLTEEQLLSLCQIDDLKEESRFNIYSIREWLTLIYEGKKEPSKTEFDLDYNETLRIAKKRGEIREEDERRLSTDLNEKLKFEIKNMFLYNNRIVNGQLSTFVPILYKDMFLNSLERSYLTKQRVEEALNKVISIDYSAFCREVLYYDKEKRIEREYIIKEVFPDIILFPTVGTNGSMWQEITGKKRDSEGRFMFPSFFESNFDDVMIRMVGRFRWELCRSIQGTSWNNIKEKSLTSEYMDYIQFYKKNSELSEERKEKLKSQIQRNRNNSREIFASDYEAWIKGEAMGALKLNKYVRELLATYCPFSKQIRDKIRTQPLFEEAMARYNRNKFKKIHELELRYHALQKDNIELTQELIDTMKFYKEL